MFERFTHDAREVVHQAQGQARELQHTWIGCEHILLAVAASPTPTGALFRDRGALPQSIREAIVAVIGPGPAPVDNDDKVALSSLGIDLDEVRHAVEATFGSGSLEGIPTRRRRGLRHRLRRRQASCMTIPGRVPFTPRAKRCLALSLRESLRLKHHHIGVEHLALALLGRDDTAAWSVLHHLGVDPIDLRWAFDRPEHGGP